VNWIKENWKVLLALLAVALYGLWASHLYSAVYAIHVTALHVAIVVTLWMDSRQRAVAARAIKGLRNAVAACQRAMRAQDSYADTLKTLLQAKQEQLDLLLAAATQVVKVDGEDPAPQQLYTAKAIFKDLCNLYGTSNLTELAERTGASSASLRLLRDGTVSKPMQEHLEILPCTYFHVPQKVIT
jgi:Flp pilus assembly protein TadB